MINYLKRLNPLLPELVAIILAYAVVVEGIGVWFVEDKLRYTSGLAIGIALALFMAINIASSLWGIVGVPSKKARVVVSLKAICRYLVVVAVSIAMGYFNLGNILTWFAGVMGLKVAAFAQPMIHKVFFRKSRKDESSSYET
ncbi:MAG: hypothetical protein K6A30_08885 [Lachnospiraceae bacterium]|nr:hypothetical protein [Lachnospiraceae bacterium]